MSDTPHSDTPFVLRIPRRLVLVLVAVLALVLAADLVCQYDRFHAQRIPWQVDSFLDVEQEQSVPNWFSSALMAFAALLMAGIAGAARRQRSSEAPRWATMSAVMLYLSFDEVAGLHETINSLSPVTWTIPFGVIALVVAVYFLPFVLKLRRATTLGIVLGGFIFLFGAAGLEFLISRMFLDQAKQFSYAALMAVKQGTVMLGVIVTIRTLLDHMRATAGATDLAIEPDRRAGNA